MEYLQRVQEFWAQGPTWAIWPISWNHAKCFFSYRLYGTMLRVCHVSAPVVLTSGCSGILGPWSCMGHMGHFMKSGPYLLKCFFSYRLYCTMLRVCHNSALVVLSSGCSGLWGPRSRMGHMGHFMKSRKMLLLLQIVWYNVEGLSR